MPDGSTLLVALRDPADDRAAQATFKKLIDGPIVVHTSKDAFLDWDALRRADRLRSLAELDLARASARPLLPPAKLTDYQLSRDGSFITFREDATEKTDYDVISGTQNHLKIATCRRSQRRDAGRRRQDAEDHDAALVRRWHACSRGPRKAKCSFRVSTRPKRAIDHAESRSRKPPASTSRDVDAGVESRIILRRSLQPRQREDRR